MIPLHLTISGFLSYNDPIHLDFTNFELACISGANGAGKSSLLDAITWSLFGQARKRDDSLINAQSSAADVTFEFAYEGNVYQVKRGNPRGKTSALEFSIQQNPGPPPSWKPLTEHTLRATQARIEQTLRMDYETFTNASFFLQGKADQFTQQRPGDRKRILGSILGLEIWDSYRLRAAEQRKSIEIEMNALDGRLAEINIELAEEAERKTRLNELQAELEEIAQSRLVQESALVNIRKIAASLAEQRKLVETMQRQLSSTQKRLDEQQDRLASRRQERQTHQEVIARAEEIQTAYQQWQQAQADIAYWDEIAGRFRQHEKQRQAPLDEINAAGAALKQELQSLERQQTAVQAQLEESTKLNAELEAAREGARLAEDRIAQREQLSAELQTARQRQADARAENPRLKAEMDELKERIDQLDQTEGANCPLCGQPLSPVDRQRLIDELTDQGKEMGDRFRANASLMREADQVVRDYETKIADLSKAEKQRLSFAESISRLDAQLEALRSTSTEWQAQGEPRLAEAQRQLTEEAFAPQARARLAEIDAELKAIGYDAEAHDRARRLEVDGRASDQALRSLERAEAALAPLEREVGELEKQVEVTQQELAHQQDEADQASAALSAAEAQAPNLNEAERLLLAVQEQENKKRAEIGAAQQKVLVLDALKSRRKTLEKQRQELAQKVSQLRQLERAFGKDGVPALLIEQALPQIESKANEILDRLSGGNMSVRFVTQAEYKDKRRDDLKETLDIQISDGAGTRDYEMFSGGEAFRVNFAIRLALSEVLAQRAGARLQTLVIDEGFGSQDAQGRQRLIEAINLVQQDFAKILVITHIDELKDAFPARIEVEKTLRGSTVRVV